MAIGLCLICGPSEQLVNIIQLGRHGRAEDFRDKVTESHFPVELIRLSPNFQVLGQQIRNGSVPDFRSGVVVRRFDDAHQIKIRPEALGEVFPGVHRGIGRYELPDPVGAGAILIIMLESLLVGRAPFIAEDRTERFFVLPEDQQIPVVMSQFMADMAHERPLRFLKRDSGFLPFHMIRFTEIDGDAPLIMAGKNRSFFIGGEIEHQLRLQGVLRKSDGQV